jgi:hypothetical protein
MMVSTTSPAGRAFAGLALGVVIALLGSTSALGQENMMFFGIIKDAKSGKAMHNASLRIVTDTIAGDSVFTDPQGSYQIFVPLGGLHRLVYNAEGYDWKVVEVDTRAEMEPADLNKEWNIRIDISLVRTDLVLSEELLNTPVGRSKWIQERHAFEWDTPYSERYQVRYKEEVKAVKKK